MNFDWKINGGHAQKTREGYQLLNLQSGTQNGITYYVDDEGYFYMSGTCTSDRITLNLNEIVLNGTYTFTNKSISGEGINCALKDNTSEYKNIFFTNNKSETKEVNTVSKDLIFYLTNGATYNSKIKLMLVSGSQEKDIEQYGASPSPDYPSEIETVGSNVNLFDKDNVNKLNAVPDVSSIVANFSGKSFYIKVKSNTTYTVSRKIIGSRFVVGTTANLPAAGETIIDRKVNNKGSSITLTTSKNVNYLVVYYLYNSSENEEEILDNIKIEKGSTATPGSAYGTGCVEKKVQNRNFLYYTAQNQTINDVEFLINKDKSIKVKGTATATADFYLIGNANTYEDIGVTGNFKISGCKSNSSSKYMLYIVQKDINNKLSYYQNVQESINITIKKGDTFRVFIRVLSQITVNDTIFPALQSSDDNNSIYVESKKQTIVMPVQQEMLQGDYIEDVEHHEWGKYIFTGKETIENIGKSGDITFFKTSLSNLSDFNYIDDNTVNYMCTHFKAIKVADRFQNNTFFINIEKKVSLCSQEITTIDALKAYLKARYDANDPVMIYYKLANAIDLELTEAQKAVREQKLHTYKNITNINLSDELASIDVTYKKDLDTILNNLQAQIIANASEEVTE